LPGHRRRLAAFRERGANRRAPDRNDQSRNAPLGEPIVVVVVVVVGVVDVVAMGGTFLYLTLIGSTWPRISPAAVAGGGPVGWMGMVGVREPAFELSVVLCAAGGAPPFRGAAGGGGAGGGAVGVVGRAGRAHPGPRHVTLHRRAVKVCQDLGSCERCVADRVA